MASYGLCVLLIVLMVQACSVYVHGEVIKSILTFVVYETASMWAEIRRLKEEDDTIFEKVSSSKASQIENFVLVTFNDPEPAVATAPEIEGPSKIVAQYDMSFPLKMNVYGYPVPNIFWSENDTGIVFPSKEHSVKYPYDYFSILDIENEKKNISYIITATNSRGSYVKRVDVEIST